jgi:hypothetical protein
MLLPTPYLAGVPGEFSYTSHPSWCEEAKAEGISSSKARQHDS